ncbi:hypothetical protein ACFQX4_22725 [Roseomonas sp. GCM10028921]
MLDQQARQRQAALDLRVADFAHAIGEIGIRDQIIAKQTEQIAGLNGEVEKIGQRLSELTQHIENQQKLIDLKKEDIEKRSQQLNEQHKLIEGQKRSTEEQHEVVESGEQQNAWLARQTMEQAKNVSALQATLAALYNSTSWKIGAPLRAAAKLLVAPHNS